jgi:hypothetical protein
VVLPPGTTCVPIQKAVSFAPAYKYSAGYFSRTSTNLVVRNVLLDDHFVCLCDKYEREKMRNGTVSKKYAGKLQKINWRKW